MKKIEIGSNETERLVARAILEGLKTRGFCEDGSTAWQGYTPEDFATVTGRFHLVQVAEHVLNVMAEAGLLVGGNSATMSQRR